MTTSHDEKRQLSRRITCLHASIRIPGRPPLACVVRDLSVQGAFLEFEVPDWMPVTFQLRIDVARFASDCEMRHKGPRGCGVMFADALPSFQGFAELGVIESEAWTVGFTSPALRRDRH